MTHLLTCPFCTTEFEVEDYDSGDCPNCKKQHYSWDDGWDYEKEETSRWEGFFWEKNEDF